jgi:tetratricopeptide (TPR) repeat protein
MPAPARSLSVSRRDSCGFNSNLHQATAKHSHNTVATQYVVAQTELMALSVSSLASQVHGRAGTDCLSQQWKSFDFFDVDQIKLADDETRGLFESNEISCVCAGSANLFVGSDSGHVRIVGPSWKVVRSFRAHDVGSIKHMRQVEGTSLLVTVAEDLGAGEPILKVWALDKPEPKTGIPICLSTVTINNGKKPFPITAFTATEDLSQLAVGFANGTVTLIRGNLVHDLGTKQRIVHESEEPVTGVELHVDPSNLTTLFIATTSRILKLVVSAKGHGNAPKTVEDHGCGLGCMTVDKRTGDVVVARDDAIYYYNLDGRGPPRAYDSPKKSICIFQDYVALVSDPTAAPAASGPGSMGRRFGSAGAIFNPWTFTLLETDLKLIAHTESIINPIMATFQVWGDLYTLTQGGKVYRYHEKSLQQRLEMVYLRHLYTLAIELAQKGGMDAQQRNVIYRKYGDYLYQKGKYDEAMTQYIKAIDSTEPSQVIRKFLDSQRLHNLIEYLEELHEHHKATADHTTLLLNCYAKLKDIDKLEKFIRSPGDLKFDLDTAISMCRQGGYYEQAAYLAEKHGENDLVVDILIEDCKKYRDALEFIWRLEPETVRFLLPSLPSLAPSNLCLFFYLVYSVYKQDQHLC